MGKPTLLIVSMGELGTSFLEAVARTEIFETIVVGSRDLTKAQQRANNALIGAGLEGYFPQITAEHLDVAGPDFATKLRAINPDYIFSAPSLLPWWKVDDSKVQLPFAGYMALHLSLMAIFRDKIEAAGTDAFWIGASFPDVINAVLNRTGFGPDCGIGNVQEPIAKIQSGIGKTLGCNPQDVRVHLVAQHAFEYFVLGDATNTDLPPYLIKVMVGERDVTDLADQVLRTPFPFPFDLSFNRVTASAGVNAMRALTSPTKTPVHLPGIGSLIGGYPVMVSSAGIEIDLPPEWSMEQAIATNEASLKWDGIDAVEPDGTAHYSQKTREALHQLLGQRIETLSIATAEAQAKALLSAL